MLKAAALLLGYLYVPLMWFLVVANAIFVLLALVRPAAIRSSAHFFTQNRHARILGTILMFIGAELFIRANGAVMPLTVKILAIIFFLAGGASLLIPTSAIILVERLTTLSDRQCRFISVAFLVIGLFFYAAQYFPKTIISEQAPRPPLLGEKCLFSGEASSFPEMPLSLSTSFFPPTAKT